MHTEEMFSDQHIDQLIGKAMRWAGRAGRGISYFVVAWLLISIGTYGVGNIFYLSVAIGILGVATSSARIGQLALAILLIMAVVPLNTLSTIATAIH